MANTIRIKRGLKADIEKLTLLPGELGVTLDTQELYVGDKDGNKQLVKGAAAGVVESAEKLSTARNIIMSGDATGSAAFDGSKDITIAMTLANSGVTAGTYNNVTVNAKGLITSASNVTYKIEDITGLQDALDSKVDNSTFNTEWSSLETIASRADNTANTAMGEIEKTNAEVAKKANSANVYTKEETYTKDEVDTAIKNAEVDAYTKSEMDGKLAAKANVADLGDLAAKDEIAEADLASALATKINGKAEASVVSTLSGTVGEHTTAIGNINKTLEDKADADSVYTKTEADGLLNTKANATEVYTKTAADGLLNAKANASEVYKKTETYSQTEVNNLLNAKADATEVSGALDLKATKTEVSTLNTNLTAAINTKATAATTASGYGITDVYTKAEVDGKIAGTFKFVGEVASFDKLPTSGVKAGDVYQVGEKEYAYDGDSWVELGFNIDLSSYAKSADVAATYATKQSVNEGLGLKANSADVYTKTEVDSTVSTLNTNINKKANSADVYTTTQMDTKLGGKADKATTLSGYGIADAYTKNEADALINAKATKSTSLQGYGITDAYTKTATNELLADKMDVGAVIDGGTF
jgi:phage-related tail fiber protein